MAKPTHKVLVAECPACETDIRFHKPLRLGQIVTCPECRKQLQVSELDPLELDWAYEEYEDDREDWD